MAGGSVIVGKSVRNDPQKPVEGVLRIFRVVPSRPVIQIVLTVRARSSEATA